ncbi:MAG: DUF1592 domain-containing protein [Verrucomicrobia bacterium]|nr:DUF1592 domain-containing protein [Verrucomicrobiota bacterium]
MLKRLLLWLALPLCAVLTGCVKEPAKPAAKPRPSADPSALAYEKQVRPLLEKYCYDCHGAKKAKADLALHGYRDLAAIQKDRKVWEKVMHNIRSREMPPEDKPQPTQEQRDQMAEWIESELFNVDCSKPDPGRVTLRRLNRAEYNNTIRDLVGVNFSPAEDFPPDDAGYGFDNIGDVLSVPPVLLEKYLAAAEAIMDRAVVTDFTPKRPVVTVAAKDLEATGPAGMFNDFGRMVTKDGEASLRRTVKTAGEYIFRVRANSRQVGSEVSRMEIRLNGRAVKAFAVTGSVDSPGTYEIRSQLAPGVHKWSMVLLNPYTAPTDSKGRKRDRGFLIESVEISSPPQPVALTETHQKIFAVPATVTKPDDKAREIIRNFARRAFRRPVKNEEVERYLTFVRMAQKEGENFEKGVKLALQAVLVSPHFLFRGELQPQPDNPKAVHPIDDYALATRLSYFLWSTMPDAELFALAEKKQLRPNLEKQVARMLKDPKAEALVDNFAGQWLQIRNLRLMAPDAKQFPKFDEPLRAAMERETELFFDHIMRHDRSVLEFLNGDYTFLNERLARHYGIQGVSGDKFQQVSLKGSPRGGVLTHGSILTLTSNPTRTSPVKRGKFVLENLLGTPPPPPPPDVPELADEREGKELTGTLRQRMEQHRNDPNCSGCHARMDPIGFGMENFDGIGAWRGQEGGLAVDASGKLVSGENFAGPAELRDILAKSKSKEFIRCLSEKMLTYALGRGLEYYDRCAVDEITKGVAQGGHRFSALVTSIVKSTPFLMRRGEGAQ